MTATSELYRIQELAKTEPEQAGRELTLGLMRGNESEMKLGYTAENAALAAANVLEGVSLDMIRRALTPAPLHDDWVSFLRWLAHDCCWEAERIIDVVDAPYSHWQEYADYLIAQETGTYPALTAA